MSIILVTGAAGRTSGYVLRALLASGAVKPEQLRLLVRSEESVQKVQQAHAELPRSAFVVGDYLQKDTLAPALRGVDVVFHNPPAFHPLESAMGIALIEASKAAGVKHFVFCSVLFPVLSKLLNHDCKRIVEEYLIESGLNYTILEPTSYMQNMNIKNAVESGALMCAYSPSTLQGFLDLEDLGAVASLVILNPEPHNRARYELVGENATPEDIAKTVARVAGCSKGIKCEQIARSEVIQRGVVHVRGAGEYSAEALDRMLYYYDKRGIPGNTNTVRWLLGRDPTSWEALARRTVL